MSMLESPYKRKQNRHRRQRENCIGKRGGVWEDGIRYGERQERGTEGQKMNGHL